MKAKSWLLLTGLALSGLVWNGCYTQLAQPDLEEDTQVSREAEATEEASEEKYDQREADDRHVTNVYVYGGWHRPYWYDPWNRYSRSRFYVSVGYGCYDPFDPWGWCGTPWSWYDPWDSYYYTGWRPSYYYDPFYYPNYVYRDRVVEQKKRTITRRGSTPPDDNSSGAYTGSGGSSTLARPAAGTFARGDDGSYRRVRRTGVTSTDRRNEPTSVTNGDAGNPTDSGRRTVKRSTSDNGKETYRKPASRGNSSGDNRGSERRGRREPNSNGSSGSGGSVSRPSGSGSSGSSAPPPSSNGSSNKGSSDRRTRN